MIAVNEPSKGEKKLMELFRCHGINFKREVCFQDLRGKKKSFLRYDFALFDKNNNLKFLIEFDGIQHFQYTPHFHKKRSDFQKAIGRDRAKNKYCLIKGIPLIRIPYWDLDNLTLNKILTNQSYRVKSLYHNDKLIKDRGEK